jgi:hypothetical protein
VVIVTIVTANYLPCSDRVPGAVLGEGPLSHGGIIIPAPGGSSNAQWRCWDKSQPTQ